MGIEREESRSDAMILPVVLLLMRTSASVEQPEREIAGGGVAVGEGETVRLHRLDRCAGKMLKD